MAAGILCIAALYFIRGREKDYYTAVRITPFIAPVLLVLGLVALFIDLRHKLFFWQLYTNIRLQSPMSWGAWTLMVITPVSFIWCALHIKDGTGNSNGYMILKNSLINIKKYLPGSC
jgi:formate-dependent nitrite reductase membrane component NrfD